MTKRIDDFLETHSYDEAEDWRSHPELGEEIEEEETDFELDDDEEEWPWDS